MATAETVNNTPVVIMEEDWRRTTVPCAPDKGLMCVEAARVTVLQPLGDVMLNSADVRLEPAPNE